MKLHTPGPWSISRLVEGCIGVSGSCESGYTPIYDAPLTRETEANARLIAAAPELADAGEAAVRALRFLLDAHPERRERYQPVLDQLEAAIAKTW